MNTKQTAHTPTPWKADSLQPIVWSPVGEYECREIIAETRDTNIPNGTATANAAFIVRACNAHDDLVAALRKAEFTLQTLTSRTARERDACVVEIRAALAKAGAA